MRHTLQWMDDGGWLCTRCDASFSADMTADECLETACDDDVAALLELAEGIADGLETGAIMLLTFEEAEFMEQVCRFEGLLVYLHQDAGLRMASRLEAGGLVTVDRGKVFWVVSAVRGGA